MIARESLRSELGKLSEQNQYFLAPDMKRALEQARERLLISKKRHFRQLWGTYAEAVFMISKDTKLQPSCYAWLDWVIGEKYATSMAKDQGYRMTTSAHLKNLSQAEIKEMQLDDIPGLMNRIFIQELPENLNDWVRAWSEFKSA